MISRSISRFARGRRHGGPSPYPTRAARRWRTGGALLAIVVFLPPLLLLVAGSLRQPGLPPPQGPQFVPDPVSAAGYERALGLTDTLGALVAPALLGTSPLYPLVYYLAFRALPAELYDACRIEDLSPLRTWWRVALPLVKPVTAAIAALTYVLTWSNFLDPLVYVYDRDLFTLPLALRSLATLDPTNFPIFLAGAVLATAPAIAVFWIAQRRFLHRYEGTRTR